MQKFAPYLASVLVVSAFAATVVFAQTATPTPSPSPTPTVFPSLGPTPTSTPSPFPTPTPKPKKGDITAAKRTCIKDAIEKRDTKIVNAFDARNSGLRNALLKRKDLLKAAWDKPTRNEIRADLDKAWKEYAKMRKELRKNFRKERLGAWQEYFRTRTRTCRVPDTTHNHDVDNDF